MIKALYCSVVILNNFIKRNNIECMSTKIKGVFFQTAQLRGEEFTQYKTDKEESVGGLVYNSSNI